MQLTDFKIPNLKAPRKRRPCVSILNSEFYTLVINQHPNVSVDKIKLVVKTYGDVIQEIVTDQAASVWLPDGLGAIILGAVKKKGINVDFKKSIAEGKVVKHDNSNTNGFMCKIFYTKYLFRSKNNQYCFSPVRQFKRRAAATFPNQFEKYIQVQPNHRISGLIVKHNIYSIKYHHCIAEIEKRIDKAIPAKGILDLYFKRLKEEIESCRHERIAVLNLGTFVKKKK